jgi:hypothetical protein
MSRNFKAFLRMKNGPLYRSCKGFSDSCGNCGRQWAISTLSLLEPQAILIYSPPSQVVVSGNMAWFLFHLWQDRIIETLFYTMFSFMNQGFLVILIFIILLSLTNGSSEFCWALDGSQVSWSYTQSVGLLGRVISQWQDLYLYTGHYQHRMKVHRCLSLKWD